MPTSTDILERIARDIHSGELKKGDVIDPELVKHIAANLMHGVGIGFKDGLKTPESKQHSDKLFKAMQTNVYQFSGFKTASQIKEVQTLLHDHRGEVRPWRDFKKDVLAVDATYNKTWLKTEYDTAARGAEMGRRWLEIKEESDALPWLTYRTVGDSRVRPEHAAMDGVTKRVDDPFWKKYYPPNDWNCRCDVEQSTDGPDAKTEPSHPDPEDDVPPMWRGNVGESGRVLKSDNYRKAVTTAEAKIVLKEVGKILEDLEDEE